MYRLIFVTMIFIFATTAAAADDCVNCHEKTTPGAVTDWKLSRHFEMEVSCDSCHGNAHTSADDVEKALTVTPETCSNCHTDRYEEYKAGKHAFAWAALNAMPTTHQNRSPTHPPPNTRCRLGVNYM